MKESLHLQNFKHALRVSARAQFRFCGTALSLLRLWLVADPSRTADIRSQLYNGYKSCRIPFFSSSSKSQMIPLRPRLLWRTCTNWVLIKFGQSEESTVDIFSFHGPVTLWRLQSMGPERELWVIQVTEILSSGK